MNPQAALNPASFDWGTRWSAGLDAGRQEREQSQLAQLMSGAFKSGNYDGEGGLSALLAEQGDVGGALKVREYAGQMDAQKAQQLRDEELDAASAAYQIASEHQDPRQRFMAVQKAAPYFAERGLDFGELSGPDQFSDEAMQTVATYLRTNGMLDEPAQPEMKPSYQTFDADGDGVNDKVSVYPDGRQEVLGPVARAPKSDYGTVVDPRTGMVYSGAGASQFMRNDASQIAKSEDEAGKAQAIMDLYQDAKDLIDGGLQTGLLGPARSMGSRMLAELGHEGNVLGVSADDAPSYEQMTAVSKELGARTLELFGGSDTEKELQVALQTNPQIDKRPEANLGILERKMRAAQILMQRPGFERDWVARYGSLMFRDDQDRSFSQVWMDYQADTWGRTNDATNKETGEEVVGDDRLHDFSQASDEDLVRVLGGQ